MTIPISERTNWSFCESAHPLTTIRNMMGYRALEFRKKSVLFGEVKVRLISAPRPEGLQNEDFS